MATSAVAVEAVAAQDDASVLYPFHCSGCGRRLFDYTKDEVGPRMVIRWRCRDCKTVSALRGADVAALLAALSHGRETAR